MSARRRNLDSTRQWDSESQRKFWNNWDMRYLEKGTIGPEALRRGQVVLSLLCSLDVKQPRILEIGCGNGWLAESLQLMGPVTGVDVADAAIEVARRRVPGVEFASG